MSHMGNMTARLKPLGLYSLESSTVVYKELLCYAQQLEAVADEISNLLKNTTMNIKQITQAMHFPNQSFLGKFFKEHVGKSPSQYRKEKL